MKFDKSFRIYLYSFFLFITISSIVLITLVGVRTIGWNWLTGFTLGALAASIGLILILESIKILMKTENHYFYYFMYLVRVGCYFIPFVLAYFISDGSYFNYFGILIGLIPVITLPYFNAFILNSKRTLKEQREKGGYDATIS